MQICSTCGDFIKNDAEVFFKAIAQSNKPLPVCGNCNAGVPLTEVEEPDFTSAWLMGLFAGILAAFVWFGFVVLTQRQFVLIAIFVGWLVGKAVLRGSGYRRHFTLQLMSVGITVITMLLSEYLITRLLISQMLLNQTGQGLPLFMGVVDMVKIAFQGIAQGPASLIFWGLAMWQAFTIPGHRS